LFKIKQIAVSHRLPYPMLMLQIYLEAKVTKDISHELLYI